jgi:hypothetical protein
MKMITLVFEKGGFTCPECNRLNKVEFYNNRCGDTVQCFCGVRHLVGTMTIEKQVKTCRECSMGLPLEYFPGFGWYHRTDGGPDIECLNPEVICKPNPEGD